MTILETILLFILWIVYGVFSAYQCVNINNYTKDDSIMACYFVMMLFAPLVLAFRIVKGIFHNNILKDE